MAKLAARYERGVSQRNAACPNCQIDIDQYTHGDKMPDGTNVRTLARNDVSILNLEREARKDLGGKIRKSLAEHGFLAVEGHGVDLELLDRCYAHSRAFFAAPEHEKLQLSYESVDQRTYSNVGYFRYRTETAVRSKTPDLKEFYHIGPEHISDAMKGYYATNVWPNISRFKEDLTQLFEQFQSAGDALFFAISSEYGIDLDYAQRLVKDGNSVLRTIHYPPVSTDAEPDAMRAAPHTGIQLLGLQPRTTHPGLQFSLPKTGEWVEVEQEGFRDALLINIGDMLEHLLNRRVRATLHRVVNAMSGSEKAHRYCIVHFYHANSLRDLVPISEDGSSPMESIGVGAWLLRRLEELNYQMPRKSSEAWAG